MLVIKVERDRYIRFDLNLPPETVREIRRAAREKTIPPRALARMLLVERVKEGIT